MTLASAGLSHSLLQVVPSSAVLQVASECTLCRQGLPAQQHGGTPMLLAVYYTSVTVLQLSGQSTLVVSAPL